LNLKSAVIDVKGAYLKASIRNYKKENLYLRLPDGTYVKLEKYIYGLKQAGTEWNKYLSNVLLENGYSQSQVEDCVFYKHIDNNNYIMLCIHW
jgi:hypothetical protein